MDVDSPVPRLGFGTWQLTREEGRAAVRTALSTGYRHIDTAELYGNERVVGAALDDAAVDREDVYLATKVLHPRAVEGAVTRESLRADVEACLDRLGVETVDLLYVHWPAAWDLELVHTTLAACRDDGLVRAVGVSNYTVDHLDTALAVDPDILANQVELHPLLPQPDLRAACADRDVDLVGYAPLAHGEVFEVPALQNVAAEHETSVAQVCLAWLRHHGVAAVPKAAGEDHIRDNWASRDLTLDRAAVERVDAIDRRKRFFDPDYAPGW